MTESRIRSTEPRNGALVDDLVFDGPDGLEVEAFLVRPTDAPPDASLAGILMWHWLDSEAPDGNRTQYLDEAADLAAAGAVCLLPQGRFPWSQPPTGSAADTAEILAWTAGRPRLQFGGIVGPFGLHRSRTAGLRLCRLERRAQETDHRPRDSHAHPPPNR